MDRFFQELESTGGSALQAVAQPGTAEYELSRLLHRPTSRSKFPADQRFFGSWGTYEDPLSDDYDGVFLLPEAKYMVPVDGCPDVSCMSMFPPGYIDSIRPNVAPTASPFSSFFPLGASSFNKPVLDSLSQDSDSASRKANGPADGQVGNSANSLGGRSLDPFSGGFSMKILEPMAKYLVPDPRSRGVASSCRSSLPDPGLMAARSQTSINYTIGQTSLNEKVVPPAGATSSIEPLEDVELMGLPSCTKPDLLPKMGNQPEPPGHEMASCKSAHTGLHAGANQYRFFFDSCTKLPATPEKENMDVSNSQLYQISKRLKKDSVLDGFSSEKVAKLANYITAAEEVIEIIKRENETLENEREELSGQILDDKDITSVFIKEAESQYLKLQQLLEAESQLLKLQQLLIEEKGKSKSLFEQVEKCQKWLTFKSKDKAIRCPFGGYIKNNVQTDDDEKTDQLYLGAGKSVTSGFPFISKMDRSPDKCKIEKRHEFSSRPMLRLP